MLDLVGVGWFELAAVAVVLAGILATAFEAGRWLGWRDGHDSTLERRIALVETTERTLVEAKLALMSCEDLANGIRRFPRLEPPPKSVRNKLLAGGEIVCERCGGGE